MRRNVFQLPPKVALGSTTRLNGQLMELVYVLVSNTRFCGFDSHIAHQMIRETGTWMATKLVDMRGQEFAVGDKVAKAYASGRSVNLSVATVARIEDGKMYLDDSHVAIRFPGRLLIVTKVYQ